MWSPNTGESYWETMMGFCSGVCKGCLLDLWGMEEWNRTWKLLLRLKFSGNGNTEAMISF